MVNALQNKLLIVLTCVLLLGFNAKHPFYLGITHFKYNNFNKSFETSVKLFVNDLEAALRKISSEKIDLINGTNKETLNEVLKAYIKTHLIFSVNNQIKEPEYVGFEIEKDIIWIYIEYKKIKNVKTISIQNTFLYDYIKQQTNIVRVEINKNDQTTKLNNPEKLVVHSY